MCFCFQQHPIKHSCCVSLRRDLHLKSFVLTVLIYGCLGAIIWCRFAQVTTVILYYERHSSHVGVSRTSPCADGYIYIPIAFVILLYLVYLVECWHCHTRIELKHKVDVQTVYHKMRQMREALPIVWWKALCYHYIRRTRQVTRYRNGDAFTSTQVYYERVNSHTAGCAFNFTNCGFKDVTKVVTGLEDYPATKIRFSKSFSFLHPDAKCEFDDQRNQFFVENERRDDYMETREGLDLLNVNFKEYMIAFKDPDRLPWYVSNIVFWIASFLMLSWPLRVIIEYKTAYIHYHVHKVFGTNYVSSQRHAAHHMPRATTMGSVDLEMIVRNNFSIVPSYSEALLMNENATSTHTLHDANANITSPVLGPTRSITWNNISQSASSGYISGFFSSSNVPGIIHSESFHNNVIPPGQPVHRRSIHSSLRNMLRSPWSRHRKYNTKTARSKTMFMLSSPTSVDDYSVSPNHQALSDFVSRNYCSFNDIHSVDASNGMLPNNVVSGPFPQDNNVLDTYPVSSGVSTSVPTRDNVPLLPTMQTIKEANSPRKVPLDSDKCNSIVSIQSRPSSFIFPKCDPKAHASVYIKSNLPTIPLSNILSESCQSLQTVVDTPSSPPAYEEALYMHAPCVRPRKQCTNQQTERSSLIDNSRPSSSNYNTMMETSL